MKEFRTIQFDPVECRRELDRLQLLLESKSELSERDDLLPLFKDSPQMAAFLGTCIFNLGPANRLAYEFQIYGDFSADLFIGNIDKSTFCAIELEDARTNSIFNKIEGKSTSEWGRRFERGFSQLIDWFYSFDDHKNSAGFTKHFGYGHIDFSGMLLIGRSNDVSEPDRARLRWRSDRVSVNTHKIACFTHDELLETLNNDWRLLSLTGATK